jgi:hypothetical protein
MEPHPTMVMGPPEEPRAHCGCRPLEWTRMSTLFVHRPQVGDVGLQRLAFVEPLAVEFRRGCDGANPARSLN